MKPQERLADNNLVTVTQRLALSRLETLATVYKGSVGRAQIFQEILTVG
jgi:hypothetical protein